MNCVLLQAERINIEERYSSLQDEAQGLSRKLKKVTAMLLSAREELKDVTAENQREMEGLLDSVRQLTKELALQETIQNIFIPDHYRVGLLNSCVILILKLLLPSGYGQCIDFWSQTVSRSAADFVNDFKFERRICNSAQAVIVRQFIEMI